MGPGLSEREHQAAAACRHAWLVESGLGHTGSSATPLRRGKDGRVPTTHPFHNAP